MPLGATDFHAGRKVGKYEILTLLSMGGMAELFLAFTAGPGGFRKFVALKQILPDIKKDESFVKMFLDEARITAAFTHSNIGQVFDLGEEEGELYLAMEFISGQNLEQVVKACRKRDIAIPVGFAAMAVRDCCLGLHYAHHFVDPSGRQAPVIHRDVSPKNVMVTYDGNIKVIDFGIAKAKGRLNRTQAGMVKGTTGYMSPEQVRNEPLDGRSDLFSAAVMLHELLTGQRLFDGPSDAATMIQIVEGEIPSPRKLNRQVPEALAEVVLKALSRSRDERYATGKELARAIEAAAGPELFDEERAAAFMQDLFADKVAKTRALLEMASRDDGELSRAAGALREEGEAVTERSPRPRAPSGLAGGPGGTPAGGSRSPSGRAPAARSGPPREGQVAGSRTPRGREVPGPGRTPPSRTPPSRTSAPTRTPSGRHVSGTPGARRGIARAEEAPEHPRDRFASSVAASYALYSDPDAKTVQKAPAPVPADRGERATSVRPAIARPAEIGRRRWYSVGKGSVFLLLLACGIGFAATRLDGPLGDQIMPLYKKAEAWVRTEFAGEPPPPPPTAIIPRPPPGPPPGFGGTPAAPAPQPDVAAVATGIEEPEVERPGADAEPKEDRRTVAAGMKGPRTGTVGTSKPAVGTASSRTAPATGTARTAAASPGEGPPTSAAGGPPADRPVAGGGEASAVAAGPAQDDQPVTTVQRLEDEVEVLDTRSSHGAAADGVGWLTLYTVPPAFVYDGATRLGTTPLIKVPLPVGVYRLRLVDPDSKYRVLSVPIRPGQVTDMKISVNDLPLDSKQD